MKPKWHKAEDFWADFFPDSNGRRQPGSGNQPGKPGDVRYKERINFAFDHIVLLESKQTGKKYLTIHGDWLEKISLEAAQLGGRVPLLGLTIGDEQWLAIPAWAIQALGNKGDSHHAGRDQQFSGDDGERNQGTEP